MWLQSTGNAACLNRDICKFKTHTEFQGLSMGKKCEMSTVFFFLNIAYDNDWAQMVKNSPAVQETWVRSLGWEDPMEECTATHSSILACRIPWTKEPGGLRSTESQRS